MLRQIFLSCLASFSAFFRPDEKNLLLFFIRIIRFSGPFSLRRDNFYVFSRPEKEIFLPVFIIFALLLEFSGRKILIFRNEFSVRTNIFSLPRGVFPDFFFVSSDKEFYPSRGIFRSIRQEFSPFRLIFARTRRARTCTRVIIY